jgi:TorA maturation chaperone TorD
MNAVQDKAEPVESRADLYTWFSSVFAREQDRDSWEIQTSPDFLDLLRARAAEFELTDEAEALADYLANRDGDDLDELLLDLAVDYAQLFIGPGPGQAPPYESVYTSPDGRLYGEAYADVIDTLQRERIEVAGEFSAPADHAAVELAVLAHLIARDEVPDTGGGEAEASFLRTHLLNWLPRWCADVDEHARTEYYRGAARLLLAFLDGERRRLEGTPSA